MTFRVPDAREGAIILLRLIQTKEGASRVRLSELTVKRLLNRTRLKDDFIDDVAEWMFRAGWTLINAGRTYAAVKSSIIENWPRLSSKRLASELAEIANGTFDFDAHAGFFHNVAEADQEAE